MSVSETTTEFRRDEKGRPVGDDGIPTGGLATPREVAAVTSLSLSKIYQMIASGEIPSRPFGRARRVDWTVVRCMFLGESA